MCLWEDTFTRDKSIVWWFQPTLYGTIFRREAEQITVRIVQIMIQATDLAQILYGGHYSRK